MDSTAREKLKALVVKWRIGDQFFPRGGLTNSLYEEVADELDAVIDAVYGK